MTLLRRLLVLILPALIIPSDTGPATGDESTAPRPACYSTADALVNFQSRASAIGGRIVILPEPTARAFVAAWSRLYRFQAIPTAAVLIWFHDTTADILIANTENCIRWALQASTDQVEGVMDGLPK